MLKLMEIYVILKMNLFFGSGFLEADAEENDHLISSIVQWQIEIELSVISRTSKNTSEMQTPLWSSTRSSAESLPTFDQIPQKCNYKIQIVKLLAHENIS